MMEKLDRLGVNSYLILWIFSYLSGRIQFVKLNNISKKTLHIWVPPQGGVLSPFLFILYTNDFSSNFEKKLMKYTDDTVALGMISKSEV